MISIHATPTGRDQSTPCLTSAAHVISIHATPTGRDLGAVYDDVIILISIHATPTGRDRFLQRQWSVLQNFNSRDPYGPRCRDLRKTIMFSISIHATPTGRDCYTDKHQETENISIHATPTGRDRNIQQIIAINLLRFSYIPYKKAWIRS